MRKVTIHKETILNKAKNKSINWLKLVFKCCFYFAGVYVLGHYFNITIFEQFAYLFAIVVFLNKI